MGEAEAKNRRAAVRCQLQNLAGVERIKPGVDGVRSVLREQHGDGGKGISGKVGLSGTGFEALLRNLVSKGMAGFLVTVEAGDEVKMTLLSEDTYLSKGYFRKAFTVVGNQVSEDNPA